MKSENIQTNAEGQKIIDLFVSNMVDGIQKNYGELKNRYSKAARHSYQIKVTPAMVISITSFVNAMCQSGAFPDNMAQMFCETITVRISSILVYGKECKDLNDFENFCSGIADRN